jgi:hypothetical protein
LLSLQNIIKEESWLWEIKIQKKILDSEHLDSEEARLWTRWRLWTSEVLITVTSASLLTLKAEVQHTTYKITSQKKKGIRTRPDQASTWFNHLSEVKDQQRDVGKKSSEVNTRISFTLKRQAKQIRKASQW